MGLMAMANRRILRRLEFRVKPGIEEVSGRYARLGVEDFCGDHAREAGKRDRGMVTYCRIAC